MESDQRRKRKSQLTRATAMKLILSFRSLTLCISTFLFLLFYFSTSDRSPFQPVLRVSGLTRVLPNRLLQQHPYINVKPVIESRVLLPDHLLLILSNRVRKGEVFDCVYYPSPNADQLLDELLVKPSISSDEYQESKSVVRCEVPPGNYSSAVDLRRSGEVVDGVGSWKVGNQTADDWGKLVYEAILDWNTVVVLVKGLNLKPRREVDPSGFKCHFALTDFNNNGFYFTTEAIAAAQEVVRCLLPKSIRNNNTQLAEGIRVTISETSAIEGTTLPSVARVYNPRSHLLRGEEEGGSNSNSNSNSNSKYELCACTMLWNQAAFIKEWVMYHGYLGVERWFIYDNNSDDGIESEIETLNQLNHNITRHLWPWTKSQEAGFSHCALRAKYECKWVGFFDVDEFFYLYHNRGPNSLRSLISNYSDPIAEVRTACHSFGPSGLIAPPPQGVTVGYTCRLAPPERHKSIVRPELLDVTLLNIVHHFKLREGYKTANLGDGVGVINHYKYQVWDTFKAKFFRRVSAYVTNWQEDHNKGSKDRAPGLGTEAVEPEDWRLRFCDVWDTGLKDFVLGSFADVATGLLPWEEKDKEKESSSAV
ncbi:Glycosyltransferase family 92 protein RCOM_0530710 [Linum grandiflorum]